MELQSMNGELRVSERETAGSEGKQLRADGDISFDVAVRWAQSSTLRRDPEKSPPAAADAETKSPLEEYARESVPASEAVPEEEEGDVEYFCGVGPWHPASLQRLRDARIFTFLLCLFSTVEGALVSGLTAVVLSTIEHRYRLTSTQTGALASMTDIAVVTSVIFISYLGWRSHKPRWLGVALIVEAIGAFVFSLPQFLFGQYEAGSSSDRDTETCGDGIDFSSECTSANNAAYFFFIMGNIIIGVGAAPLFTIGTSYIDEIVHPKYVSIHLGIFYMMAIIGPTLGFGLGGLFLSVYVDPSVDTHLTAEDPGWVGAWWLCYIFCGILCLLISIPFFLFPRLLPDSGEIRKLREREMALKGRSVRQRKAGDRWSVVKEFPLELKKIAMNPSWLFVTLGLGLSSVALSGFTSFGVKYSENQFGLTTSYASLTLGARSIPAAGTGVIFSGLLIYFFKIRGRKLPLVGLVSCSLAVFTVFGFLIHCPTPQLAGVIVPYADGSEGASDTTTLSSQCFSSCNCTSSVFDPVCGADGLVYFTPCHAGCPPSTNGSLERCSCVAQQLSLSLNLSLPTPPSLLANSSASEGLCRENCTWQFPVYLIITAFTLFFVFMVQIPNITITIRCVAEEQRTLALGLQSSIIRLIGFVPGPVLFGLVFDSACLFWQRDCGRRGNCWVYDNSTLSMRAVLLALLAMMCYIFFIILCWLFYPKRERSSSSSTATNEGDEGERRGWESSMAYTLYDKCNSMLEERLVVRKF